MKNIHLLLALFSISICFGQEEEITIESIAESEMKSATQLVNFVVNPNTLNYDITYHKLEFTVNPAVYFISGKVTTTYTALANMSTITFDFANELTASSVKRAGVPLAFVETATNELVITLPATQSIGTSDTIEITYSGVPPVNGFNAFTTSTHGLNIPVLFTLSEPFGARDWWPCKQDLNDKINTIDVYVTAPSQYVSVSNGIEPEAPVVNGTQKTTHFRHNYPIPAYLIAIAVTNYTVVSNQTAGTAPNQFPIIDYVYPESLTTTVQTQLLQTPLLINFFESVFEKYPFHAEKYGHAQFGWGGGMEHTTVSFMQNFSRSLIAHELAHQWFGDKITCGTWKDIWLNEGFATYLAAMVIENFDGAASFISEKTTMIGAITYSTSGAVYLTDDEATNVSRIFSSRLSYNKGAMVLNMLRFKMGDALFFQGLKNYLADVNLAFKYAVTANLQAHLEAVYGSSLNEFFLDWVYRQGYPTYAISVQNLSGGQVKLIVNQTQSHSSVTFFEMPVPVRVMGAGGQFLDLVLQNTENGQVFIENVPFTVTSVSFDVNKNIISKNNSITLDGAAFELEQPIQLFPNPVSSLLSIDMPSTLLIEKALIYNSLGQIILQTKAADSWDVSALSSGVYYLRIVTNKGEKRLKFIKK